MPKGKERLKTSVEQRNLDPHIRVIETLKRAFPKKSKLRILFGHWPKDINYDEYDIFIQTIELQTYVDDQDHDAERSTVELHIIVSKQIKNSLDTAGKIGTKAQDILTANGIVHTAMAQAVVSDKVWHSVCWVYL